jgi:hypothetical protein
VDVRPPPASCDDVYPADDDHDLVAHTRRSVVARLELGRATGKPQAGDVSFGAAPFPGDAFLPVLICIDSDHTSAGWVTFDDAALANPSNFNPGVQRLEFHEVVEARTGKLAATIGSKPGATLVARVIADPGRYAAAVAEKASALTASPASPSAAVPSAGGNSGGGCGTGGAGPLAGLAMLVALRLRRR